LYWLQVKESDWQGWKQGASSAPNKTSVLQPHSTQSLVDGSSTITFVADPNVEFWGNLKMYLLKHFSEEDASKISNSFMEQHTQYMDSLSLDDIERLAQLYSKKVNK